MIIAVDGPTSNGLGEANVRFRPIADIATRLSGGTEHQTGLLPKRVVATDETST